MKDLEGALLYGLVINTSSKMHPGPRMAQGAADESRDSSAHKMTAPPDALPELEGGGVAKTQQSHERCAFVRPILRGSTESEGYLLYKLCIVTFGPLISTVFKEKECKRVDLGHKCSC